VQEGFAPLSVLRELADQRSSRAAPCRGAPRSFAGAYRRATSKITHKPFGHFLIRPGELVALSFARKQDCIAFLPLQSSLMSKT
jgi:hypothetical protein